MTEARHYASSRANADVLELPQNSTRGTRAAGAQPMWNLTPQQWRVFMLVGKALSNKAIAHELKVAESTVKAHVSAIFKMAGCRNRTEAALLSQRIRFGITEADEAAPIPFAMTAVASGMKAAHASK